MKELNVKELENVSGGEERRVITVDTGTACEYIIAYGPSYKA